MLAAPCVQRVLRMHEALRAPFLRAAMAAPYLQASLAQLHFPGLRARTITVMAATGARPPPPSSFCCISFPYAFPLWLSHVDEHCMCTCCSSAGFHHFSAPNTVLANSLEAGNVYNLNLS